MANTLTIAAAGSGKTTSLVSKALAIDKEPVLITTYTDSNQEEIIRKFIELNGTVPSNVTIQTWFSFLIQHGAKPYQSLLHQDKITGLLLVNKQSGFRFKGRGGFPVYFKETHLLHYFTSTGKIYSDKLSKFVVKIIDKSQGLVLARLSRLFPHIFIDEAQDLAGYDLEVIRLLASGPINLHLVCDPRQVTYLTHNESKHAKYGDGKLLQFVTDAKLPIEVDEESLVISHRCNEPICALSNQLYPGVKPSQPGQNQATIHDGVFLVRKEDVQEYLDSYPTVVQLRWDTRTKDIAESNSVLNFGQSKGLSFDRVLIYPTGDMLKWLKDHTKELKNSVRAKLYVGITRARFSVAIVCENYDGFDLLEFKTFKK